MNKIFYCLIFLFASKISAQNVIFSCSVDNSSSTVSVVSVYAQGTLVTGNTMCSFGITLYYDNAEASITLPANVDYTPASTNLGWVIGSNTTQTNTVAMNGEVPIIHTNTLEISPLDENLAGTPVPLTPTLMFKLTFTKAPGDPASGGEVFLGAVDVHPSLQYSDINLDAWPVNATGERIVFLPLSLVSFKAEKSGDRSSALSWITTNEENTSHFTIERSFDKKIWTNVGKVNAAGYSLGIEYYSFDDIDVYNGLDKKLIAYYRLLMVDLDTRSKSSPVASVVFGNSSLTNREFTVYPNPASNGVQIEWDADNIDQPTSLEFYDLTGKLIFTQPVSDNTNQEYVDFTKTTIQPGLHLLRIMSGDVAIEHKQIIVGQR